MNQKRKPGKKKKSWTVGDRERIKGRLRPLFCSTAWEDDSISAAESAGVAPRGISIARELHRLGIYPPADPPPRKTKARRRPTLMRRCARCASTWYPPQDLTTRTVTEARQMADGGVERVEVAREVICEHCRQVALLPPERRNIDFGDGVLSTDSQSARAIMAMEDAGAVIREASIRGAHVRDRAMPSEDVNDLLEEIMAWDETGWVIECYRNHLTGKRRRVYVERDDDKLRIIVQKRELSAAECPVP